MKRGEPSAVVGMQDSNSQKMATTHRWLQGRSGDESTRKRRAALRPTVGIRRRFYGMQELHRLDIVEIDLVFEDNDQPFAVQFHS